jgi:hypothetical protein
MKEGEPMIEKHIEFHVRRFEEEIKREMLLFISQKHPACERTYSMAANKIQTVVDKFFIDGYLRQRYIVKVKKRIINKKTPYAYPIDNAAEVFFTDENGDGDNIKIEFCEPFSVNVDFQFYA